MSDLKVKDKTSSLIIYVFGKGYVGKNELIYKFINFIPSEEYEQNKYKSNINIEGKDYELEIYETPGEEDYQNMSDMWISLGEGFLLVFSINEKESFELIQCKYHRILKRKHGIEVPIVLVGNRIDSEGEREVSFDEAAELAYSWGIEYTETCTKTNLNCKEPFEVIAKEILIFRKGKLKEYRKKLKKKGKKKIGELAHKYIPDYNKMVDLFKFINY